MELIKVENLTLSSEQWAALLPYLVVATGGMLTVLVSVVRSAQSATLAMVTAIATALIAIVVNCGLFGEASQSMFNNMMVVDSFSVTFNVLFLGITALVALASKAYLEREKIHYGEYYGLLIFACLGMMFLAAAQEFVTLFVSLEIMSIAVYVLVGFRRVDLRSNEAALKYFILGSAASALMLFGMGLVYGATGTMQLSAIFAAVQQNANNLIFVVGALLVVIGFLFKVASVPFHMWMPDVYEGAPISVTSFMTTGLKAAAFASFLRVYLTMVPHDVSVSLTGLFYNLLWVSALLTMFIGNVVALTQRNLKRMLAYSSIAHTGYLLIGFIAGATSNVGYSAVVAYLITYVAMNLGAFTVLGMLGERGDRNTDLSDIAGIGFKRPWIGLAMTIFMFSMAGVPPTAGFAGKYLIFNSAVQAGEIKLAILSVLCSAISAYYYLQVIVYMYMKEPLRDAQYQTDLAARAVVGFTATAVLLLGLFPSTLFEWAKRAVQF